MSPTAVPTRITIDFRDALHPSRSWILGLGADPEGRVDLLAFESDGTSEPARAASRPLPRRRPTALSADCACPDYCERDHANE
jgi:hypothetical protein